MTLFEALTGGAFDRLNWQHSEEWDQFFSETLKCPGVCPGGGLGGFRSDRYINSLLSSELRLSTKFNYNNFFFIFVAATQANLFAEQLVNVVPF